MCYIKDHKSSFKQISSELMHMQAVQWQDEEEGMNQNCIGYIHGNRITLILYMCVIVCWGCKKINDKMSRKVIIWGRVLGRVPIRIIYPGSLDHLEEVI